MKARDASGRSSRGLFAVSHLEALGDQWTRTAPPVAACPEAPGHRVGDPQERLRRGVDVLVGEFGLRRAYAQRPLQGVAIVAVAVLTCVKNQPVGLQREKVLGKQRET